MTNRQGTMTSLAREMRDLGGAIRLGRPVDGGGIAVTDKNLRLFLVRAAAGLEVSTLPLDLSAAGCVVAARHARKAAALVRQLSLDDAADTPESSQLDSVAERLEQLEQQCRGPQENTS